MPTGSWAMGRPRHRGKPPGADPREATAFIAGTSSLGWRPSLVAALVGSVPAALLHAVAGALAASFATGAVVFAVVILPGLVVVALSVRGGRQPVPVARR